MAIRIKETKSLDLKLEITCNVCGSHLEFVTEVSRTGHIELFLEPCPNCILQSRLTGVEDGKQMWK